MIYIIILISFFALIFFLQKNQKKQIETIQEEGKSNTSFKDMARTLGLSYEDLKKENNSSRIFFVGSRACGEYKGIPLEILFSGESDNRIGPSGSYSFSLKKTFTFTVKNKRNKAFDILPRKFSEGGTLTNNEPFDTHLRLIGDAIIPSHILDYFGSLGWMHLTLKGNKLTFHDTFYEQFHGVSGTSKMIETIHPIWKTSVQSATLPTEEVKKFLDILAEFIYHEDLV